jgi:hypothetical protein
LWLRNIAFNDLKRSFRLWDLHDNAFFFAMTLQSSCPLKNARPAAPVYLPRRSVAKVGDRRFPRANRLRTFHLGDAGLFGGSLPDPYERTISGRFSLVLRNA